MTTAPRQPLTEPRDAIIPNGTSITASMNLFGHILTGVLIPATWTAADLTFQGSPDGTTYGDVHNSAGEVVVAGTAGAYVSVNPADFYGLPYLRVRSGTSASAVNQGAERTIIMSMGRPDFN